MSRLDAFVPALACTHLAGDSARVDPCIARNFRAAVLFADLAGFSALAERLALQSARGAEDLRDHLNLFFARLVDLVHAHGGQVVSFPGDAVLAVWPAHDGDHPSTPLRLAARCGLAARDASSDPRLSDPSGVRLRVGLGHGDTWAADVGGVDDQWYVVVAGESLTQAIDAMKAARPGEVVVSAGARESVAPYLSVSAVTPMALRIDRETASPALPNGALPNGALPNGALPNGARAPVHPAELEPEILRRYVPRLIRETLGARQTDWSAEFRRLSVLFVNLGPLESAAPDVLERLQSATRIVQTVVRRYGGNVGHLVADDKGVVFDCGWGLALHAHADDAVRAARATIELRSELAAIGITASFGLATGDVFTGLRGNHERCDFAMIGSVVNLAAALMQVSASTGEIVCDPAFCEAAGEWARFEPLRPLALKGHDTPVRAYRLVDVARPESSPIVGRVRERRVLEERLDLLVTEGTGSVIVIEGEGGIGKTCLMSVTMERAVTRGVRVVVARGDAIERSVAHHVWRGCFDALFGFTGGREAAGQHVNSLLASEPHLQPFAPLLNPVLGLELEDNEQSSAVTPRGRAALTRELLVYLFTRAVGDRPALLALEDTQWFDSASWALAEGIATSLPRLLVLIATRPIPMAETPPELLRIAARDSRTALLRLEPLTREETRTLACRRLRARALDDAVERVILQRSEGHPFFIEEIAQALRDRGLVHIDDAVCRFTGAAEAHESFQLPTSVRVMVSSRIDQLAIPEQLTLKVASVFGRTFALESLRAVHPMAIDAAEAAAHIAMLVDRELIRVSETSLTQYEFKHAITQDVAYSLLSSAQRRQLHAAVAGFYESHHDGEMPGLAPRLADHWQRAGVGERALFYCERAGEDALARFANQEAIRFFGEALALDARGVADKTPADITLPHRTIAGADARRTRWRRCLGEAYVNLGQWREGWAQLDAALAPAGYKLPRSNAAWAARIAGQLARQAGYRCWPPEVVAGSDDAHALLVDNVLALQRICNISYVTARKVPLLYCMLTALNLSERLGPSLELALLYAAAGNVSGLMGAHRVARFYMKRARAVARVLNRPSVDARILGRTSIYRLAVGDWETCDDIERSMTLAEQVGDPVQWEESAALRARAAHLRGEFEVAVRLGEQMRARSSASGMTAHEVWGIDAEAWGFLYLGQHAHAFERAAIGLSRARHGDRVPFLDLLGVSALVYAYGGDWKPAAETADRIVAELKISPRPGHFAILGMSAAAETYAALAEHEASEGARAAALDQLSWTCGNIERYARINPPAKVRGLLWRGCLEHLSGRPARAGALWHECLGYAARFGLPYETARAHYEIGRHLAPGGERGEHLARARDGFRHLHVAFELTRAETASLERT